SDEPKAVLGDRDLLTRLDGRELRAGLFEALKCGVIRDPALFEFMRRQSRSILGRDRKALERIITDSISVKAAVVSADEKETDLRRILNFGHTVGHALEAAAGYTHFLHGEAVGWGMVTPPAIARDCGVCTPEIAGRIAETVKAYGPLPRVECTAEEIISRLSADKKTIAGAVHFVLPIKIGKVKVAGNVPPSVVRNAVDQIRHDG